MGTPTYEWFKNGVAIPNTDNPSYLPPASDFLAAGNIYYHAQVYLSGNGCDTAISDSANIVIVNDPIVTLIDTITQTVCLNGIPTNLVVEVQNGSGTSDPYIYQWMQVGVGPAPGNDSTDTYTPSTANIGTEYYYCIVTQQASGCQDISDTAEVIVTSAPEITLDPVGDLSLIHI